MTWTGYFGYPLSLTDRDTGEKLTIQSATGADYPLLVQSFQVAGADVRAAVSNAPFRPGTIDSTLYGGAAAVTLNVTVLPPDAHPTVDVLRSWIRPSRRSYFLVQRTGWTALRRLFVRGDALAAPVVTATSDGPMVVVQMAFRAIDGVWEDNDLSSRTIFPGGTSTSAKTYPLSFPMNYGTGTPPGAGTVASTGNTVCPIVARIYGPVTAPALVNNTTGQTIAFTSGFTIPAGQYVSIDTAAATVLANDDPTLSRFNSIDWSQTDLWWLQPGNNQIGFTGSALSSVTQAVITWRERHV